MKKKTRPIQKKEKDGQEDQSFVRTDVVAYYKNKIALGEYLVKSEEIAEKMVQRLKEQPTPRRGGSFALVRL